MDKPHCGIFFAIKTQIVTLGQEWQLHLRRFGGFK